ncbi:MAG: integration host factor subunit beta [Planctomycetaceae bacterium]|nr:integration host factor subunit beta [Planctomycetaceae bacterium]
MTKKEIVKTISEECNLTQLVTKKVVQMTFEAIIETLVEEGRIELRNFGVFEVKKRAARKARNPRSGERVHVPEKYVVTFKPGKEMEEKVLALQESGKSLPESGMTSVETGMDDAPPTAPQQPVSFPPTNPPPAPPSFPPAGNVEPGPGPGPSF